MIENLINRLSIHGNWVDLAFFLVIILFILTQRGFINTFIEAASFIFSLIASYRLYAFFGQILVANFSFPKGISNALGFFIAWVVAETLFYFLLSKWIAGFFSKFQKHPLNISLGFIAAILQATLIFLFFVSFIFAFPVRGQIKQAILDSRTGPFFVDLSRSFESSIKNIFGDAIHETLNFLTIKPESNERLDLGFRTAEKKLSPDSESEQRMFELINQERVQNGGKRLVFENAIRDVAREYAKEMFVNGFFSHVSAVDGSSPADRATRAGITFYVIGENLAFAPDVYVAHQGLMNSEGHRKNILSEDYGKVGIGVIDGGIYGRMFVQEFTN